MTFTREQPATESLEDSLKKLFGYSEFRDHQKEIVTTILQRKDVIAILPTGAGKSICYQLPAMLMPGIAVVISPLISLMKDQVVSLSKNGIAATYINSTMPVQEIDLILDTLNEYKLLYIAPERLSDHRFLNILRETTVSFFAVDEAHCISQWGHSFRPEYRQLSILRKYFPNIGLLAVTATATRTVEEDIATQLAMTSPHRVKASFNRTNLIMRIVSKYNGEKQVRDFLEKHPNESGIIYSGTRRNVDETYEWLKQAGFKVGKYHAGMNDADRFSSQHDFVHGDIMLMVATVAFGMGIHKPDIRFIIHLDMPRSIEQYYQEIGRAGRDGLTAECMLMYAYQDYAMYLSFLKDIEDKELRASTKDKLDTMYSLCTASECRRKRLLSYFGETYSGDNCGSCDNCVDEIDVSDGTIVAQKIISCVYRLQHSFGVRHVIDVLRGSKNQNVLSRGHDNLSTYGLLKEYSDEDLRHYIYELVNQGYLQQSGEYPVLKWTDKTRSALNGVTKVLFRKKTWRQAKKMPTMEYDSALYDILVQLRSRYAVEGAVPAYVIFSDRTLMEIANTYPIDRDTFLNIHGVGVAKWDKYGKAFSDIVAKYCRDNGIVPAKVTVAAPSRPISASGNRPVGSTPTREQSAQRSLDYILQGDSIAEVASKRGLAKSTILDHICDRIESGIDVDIGFLVPVERQAVINKVIAEIGAERLAPIKAMLADDYCYEEIRLVAAFHRRKKPGESEAIQYPF